MTQHTNPRCQFLARCTSRATRLVWTGPSGRALWACPTCDARNMPQRDARMRDLRADELDALSGTSLHWAASDELRRREAIAAGGSFRRLRPVAAPRLVATPIRAAHVSRYRTSGRPADLRGYSVA